MKEMRTRIRAVHFDTLSCEPILRRMTDGSLLCVSQCGDVSEPALDNRVYAFSSYDNGENWTKGSLVYPESGEAVYVTEVMALDGVVSAFLEVHNGKFLNMRCVVMQSTDCGKSWINAGAPPFFPSFCFIRGMLPLMNGEIAIPYQAFPVSEEENFRLITYSHNLEFKRQKGMWDADIDHVESGVLISSDRGKTYAKFEGPDISIKGDTGRSWVWTEPTIAQLSDGTIVMLLRVDGSGCYWRSESMDFGRTWTEAVRTDIPNPSNKPKLIPMPDGRIALIHTPNTQQKQSILCRYPLEMWISDDDMKTFSDRRIITDFPGFYSYPDGFYEYGHIMFTIELNRHDILFFDCEI